MLLEVVETLNQNIGGLDCLLQGMRSHAGAVHRHTALFHWLRFHRLYLFGVCQSCHRNRLDVALRISCGVGRCVLLLSFVSGESAFSWIQLLC